MLDLGSETNRPATHLRLVDRHSVDFVSLESQHAPIAADLRHAFDRVLRSSAFVLGQEVERFEHSFARFCRVPYCVGVSSGTAALALLLRAHGVGPGDEVIVPAHTFIASALAVAHVGATPVLADVDAQTGLLDPDSARSMIGRRTVAVLAVHLYGQCCDMDALAAVTRPRGVLLLEDAAQAHGALFRDRRAGSLGDGAAFSFYPSKNLGALGDGGAVCTSDETIAERIRCLRNVGQREKGVHSELGYNERLDGLQAALLSVKLPHLDAWNDARRAAAAEYRDLLPRGVTPVREDPRCASVHHLFPVRVENRSDVARQLREQGVSTGIHYAPAIHQHEAWRATKLRYDSVDNAERWAAEELSLPMYPGLGQDEIEYVARALERAMRTSGGN